jgi:hypothetical protein
MSRDAQQNRQPGQFHCCFMIFPDRPRRAAAIHADHIRAFRDLSLFHDGYRVSITKNGLQAVRQLFET